MSGRPSGLEVGGDFGGFEGRAWLNCAHQGPLPRVALAAAERALATRLFCTSWVFSFTGQAVDLAALGRVCRRAGVTFVVNGSQGVGAAPLDLAGLPVDALVCCGFKWLCGPYATGFCWLAPDLLASLTHRPAYWLHHLAQDDLGGETEVRLRDDPGAAAWDVFGTANFLNFRPWTAAVEYLLGLGVDRVAARDQALEVLDGADRGRP